MSIPVPNFFIRVYPVKVITGGRMDEENGTISQGFYLVQKYSQFLGGGANWAWVGGCGKHREI